MTPQENILARHKILHEVGRGPSATVYAAHERATGAVVALKRVDPEASKPVAGFVQQARAARCLSHPNIVRVHDAGEAAGTAYVAMEMVEGESLRKMLDAGPLPVARAIRILQDVASGLAHAHLEGVVHGALKPSNVLILPSGAAKLTDFGVGQATPPYRSPEESRGAPVDHRSDLYALGALFYEMLTGRPGDATAPPASELNPNVPRALDALLARMLVAQPAARMPGVPVLLDELQRLKEALGVGSEPVARIDEPATSPPPVEPPPDPEPAPRMRAPKPEPRRPEPTPEPRMREPTPEPRMRESKPEPRMREPAPFEALPSGGDAFRPITDRELLAYQLAMMERDRRPPPRSRSRLPAFAALALALAAVGMGLTVFTGHADRARFAGLMNDWSGRIERGIAAARTQDPPAPVAEVSRPAAPAPVAEAPKEAPVAPAAPQPSPPPVVEDEKPVQVPVPVPAPLATPSAPPPALPDPLPAKPDPLPPSGSVVARAPEPPAPADPAPAKQLPQQAQSTAKVTASTARVAAQQQHAGTARLILAVSPRGELYINGEHHGTTPPLTTFDLEPGMHRIEVRNGSRKPFLTYMTVEPGDVRRIRHDFNAKPLRPPG